MISLVTHSFHEDKQKQAFADMSASYMETMADCVNLLVTKAITKRSSVQPHRPLCNQLHLEAVNTHFPVVTTSCQRSQSVGLCERGLTKAQSPPDIQTLSFIITTVTEFLHPSVSLTFRHLMLILSL